MRRIETMADYHALRASLTVCTLPARGGMTIAIPCLDTLLVRRELVQANTYNPNRVPRDRMELLRQSIVDNGFVFPIVTIEDPDLERFVVVDGFHRYLIAGPDWLDLPEVPIVVLAHDISQRMAATWQFNKARGVHQVDLDADLIRALLEQGMSEDAVAEHLGIDLDTVHRYKQVAGIAALFAGQDYSMSWEIEDAD